MQRFNWVQCDFIIRYDTYFNNMYCNYLLYSRPVSKVRLRMKSNREAVVVVRTPEKINAEKEEQTRGTT